MRALIVFAALASFSGCTSFTVNDCRSANWEKVGYIDGRHGERATQIESHRDYCEPVGIPVDEVAYQRGYQHALTEYCTEAGGYQAGLSSDPYRGVCSKEHEKTFLPQFIEGRKTHDLMTEKETATGDLHKSQESLNQNPVIGYAARGYGIVSGHSPTEDKEQTIENLDDKIYKRNLSAPDGSLQPLPAPNYAEAHSMAEALGGFGIAITVGLGAGHAIQHHYFQDGWKWTAIDSVLITGLAVIAHNCPSNSSAHAEESSRQGCSSLAPVTFLALLGSRYFQATETWPYLKNAGTRYHEQVRFQSLVPTVLASSPALAASFTF